LFNCVVSLTATEIEQRVHVTVSGDTWKSTHVGTGGAIAPPVFGFAPPVWHAPKIVTMNTTTLLSRLFC